ncbi:MAG: M28 family peptidase [Anaerolineae bacterium]|nr:M28 family peptidase [Anaerolineae bacterium]
MSASAQSVTLSEDLLSDPGISLNGHRPYISEWFRHINMLAGQIGPRGSTRSEEHQAAEYCAREYQRLGLAPQVDRFQSATSIYLIHTLVSACMLLSFMLYPLWGNTGEALAIILAAVAMFSIVRELLFQNNPLRRLLPRGMSQNVITRIMPSDEHREDLILIGHLDTNRTPLLFSSTGWIKAWRVFSSIAFFSFCGQVFLYTTGIVTHWPWIWPVSSVSALCAFLLMALTLQAELSAYSPGANDNATGAGIVLALARHLHDEPLRHTRVWLVNTGCEEVKHYGAIDFFDRYRSEFRNPKALVFEMLGRDKPGWLTREGIISVFTYRADRAMLALAHQVAALYPDHGGHPTWVAGGHTEMADALRVGIPALTLIGLGPDGTSMHYSGPELHWHTPLDTPDRLDVGCLSRAYVLAWAFIRALDEQA